MKRVERGLQYKESPKKVIKALWSPTTKIKKLFNGSHLSSVIMYQIVLHPTMLGNIVCAR